MRSFRSTAPLALLLAFSAIWTACAGVAHSAPELEFAEPAAVGISAEQLDGIHGLLQPYIDAGKTPGFVTLVARNGKIVHLDAVGPRDVENNLPMETDTILRMYSMTKPVTAVAVMQLVDRGLIAVSDPVSEYIPEFANLKVLVVHDDGSHELVPAEVPMTVQHLLTHTSGLSYGLFNPLIRPYYKEAGIENFTDLTLEEFARSAPSAPLLNEPGAAWNYSISMDILGRIVEVASGLPFDVYLEENIFAPLGMVDTAFWVPAEKQERFAACYEAVDNGKSMRPVGDRGFGDFLSPPSMASGGGGLVGTVSDYFRFAQALLNGGELDGVRILGEAAAAEIVRDQLGPELGDSPLRLGNFPLQHLGFGYCGAVVRPGAASMFGKPGNYWWGGYASTDFWIDPQEQVVGIIATQLIPTATHPTRFVFQNAVYEAVSESPALAAVE